MGVLENTLFSAADFRLSFVRLVGLLDFVTYSGREERRSDIVGFDGYGYFGEYRFVRGVLNLDGCGTFGFADDITLVVDFDFVRAVGYFVNDRRVGYFCRFVMNGRLDFRLGEFGILSRYKRKVLPI